MDYTLPRLKQALATQLQDFLSVETVEVSDARMEVAADLAVPAFAVAAQLKEPAEKVAQRAAKILNHELIENVEASGGYINIWLKPTQLAERVLVEASSPSYGTNEKRVGQNVLIEHTDPNPFKELHIGHLYSNTVGESIARLFEASGASVHRLSYQGDVGLHIAKAVWAMGESIAWQLTRLNELKNDPDIGHFYATGNRAYDQDESAKTAINEINKKIYERTDDTVNAIYDLGKTISFDYFAEVYNRVDSPQFERSYMESESAPAGVELVKDNMDKFEESDGAVVFRGEEHGEHTRVFITSAGLPTYESKDLGLTVLKDRDYPDASLSIIITANEINAYFKVVLAALKLIKPELAAKTRHLSHGLVKLPSGKMSSRSGDVVKATELLDQVVDTVKKRAPDSPAAEANALAAIKYAFLKPTIGGDIVYDVDESIKLEGQTGPYVQYAAVRMASILSKVAGGGSTEGYDWTAEKPLLLLIARYPEVVAVATEDLAPSRVANFAYELAKEFNRYYEQTPVKDAEPAARAARLSLLKGLRGVLIHGLGLLNIPVPEKM